MNNILPNVSSKTKICIICEGNEEYDYLQRLIQIQVWNSNYSITLKNADGNGNIPARYQNEFQNDNYDVVLVFCDTDKKPYEQYDDIKYKIDRFHGKMVSNKIVIFSNPCIMQIVLLHFAFIKLTTQSKKVNSGVIEKLTNVQNYKARAEQRKQIIDLINTRNYKVMTERASLLSKNDKEVSSTNFDVFAKYLEDSNTSWIEVIEHIMFQQD